MKSSHVLLIIGAGLLVAGLVISGISIFAVSEQIFEGGALIREVSIQPGLSHIEVLNDVPAGRQLVLQLAGQPSDAPLTAVLTEPDGDSIGTYNVTQTPFTGTALTKETGNHTLEIKNLGASSVLVSGALLNSPVAEEGGGVSISDDPQLQAFITAGLGILAGVVLIIAGIIIMIIGAVKHFRSRKTPESVPSG